MVTVVRHVLVEAILGSLQRQFEFGVLVDGVPPRRVFTVEARSDFVVVGREGRRGRFLDGLAAVHLLADNGFGNLVVIGEAGRLPNDGRGSGDITLDGISAPSEKSRDARIIKKRTTICLATETTTIQMDFKDVYGQPCT